jgi:hypothetical protein
VDRTFIRPIEDTLTISAIVENPNQHPLTVLATLTNDSNAVLDSMYLFDDGLHHDGPAGDKVWANYYINNAEQAVHVLISTADPVAGDKRSMRNAAQFTSIGPLVFDTYRITSTDHDVNAGDFLQFKFTVRNNGSIATALSVTSYMVPLDTCASTVGSTKSTYGNLAPGTAVEGTGLSQYIRFNKNCAGQSARFAFDIYSNSYNFWSDTFSIYINPVSGIEQEPDIVVTEFNLKQNYPNPFNPSTTIEFTLPKSEFVNLKVFNILGEEVATVVNDKLQAGNHTYQFDGGNLASGIYMYRIDAGKFQEVRKMVLIR